ncbi:hypothetical protein AB0E04_31870 [Streptomyces sp. NPDC048251]|uniref:hypothetical protein n=1 Tax=Streptomyces sp. NPDC048251 TaxID=3154501 RepID=UPI00344529D8
MKIDSLPDFKTQYRTGFHSIAFTVNATFNFDSAEVRSGFKYGWRVRILESDRGEPFGGGDDVIYDGKVFFFTVDSSQMFGKRTITLSPDALNTEAGNEELYVQVWIWNDSTDGQASGQNSEIRSYGF